MSHAQYQNEFIDKIRPYLNPGTRYVDVFKNFRRGCMGLSLTPSAYKIACFYKLLNFHKIPYDSTTFTPYRISKFDKRQTSPYYIGTKYVYVSDQNILNQYDFVGGDIAYLVETL